MLSRLYQLIAFALGAAAASKLRPSSSPSSGCLKPLPAGVSPGETSSQTIMSFGIERKYLIHLPDGYDNSQAVPLYFSFHGADKDAYEQETLSQFSNSTFNKNGIAVYPQGLDDYWLSHPTIDTSFPNDLDFMTTLLVALNTTLCIDINRIYAAGKSNGGAFTNLIACNSTLSPYFAAFASVSGAYYNDTAEVGIGPCNPGSKMTFTPFLEFHGLNDTRAPYWGHIGKYPNTTEPPIPDFMNGWAVLNGCPSGTLSQYNQTLYGNYVVREIWTCNKAEGIVQHFSENDLGHAWPSILPNDDCQHAGWCPLGGHYVFDGTAVIMEFFGNYSLPGSRLDGQPNPPPNDGDGDDDDGDDDDGDDDDDDGKYGEPDDISWEL